MLKDESATSVSKEELQQSIAKTDQMLSQFQKTQWFRPGQGQVNEWVLSAIEPYNDRILQRPINVSRCESLRPFYFVGKFQHLVYKNNIGTWVCDCSSRKR